MLYIYVYVETHKSKKCVLRESLMSPYEMFASFIIHAVQINVLQMKYWLYVPSEVFADVLHPKTMTTVFSISINT